MAKKRTAPVVKLADFKKKLEEEHSLLIEVEDGKKYRYRGPELLTDDEFVRMAELEKSDDPASAIEVARIMMDDYDGYVAGGGSMTLLMEIVDAEVKRRAAEEDDEDAGESEASSVS